jgi:hypothetical protein
MSYESARRENESPFNNPTDQVCEAPPPRPLDLSDQMSVGIRPANPGPSTCGPQPGGGTIAGPSGDQPLSVKNAVGKLWSWIAGPGEAPGADGTTSVTGVRG